MAAETVGVRRLPLLSVLALAALLMLASAAGAAQKRVVGGQNAAPGEYPWTVALIEAGEDADTQFCAGTLVRADVVVTAAHCVVDDVNDQHLRPPDVEVLFGVTRLSLAPARDSPQAAGAYHAVQEIKLHTEALVGARELRRDVALLVLEQPIAAATDKEIVELATPDAFNALAEDVELKITGWGRTNPDVEASLSDNLKEAEVDRWPDQECGWVWGPGFTGPGADQLCALRGSAGAVIDACQADSGGPLTTVGTDPKDAKTDWLLVGSVSYGSEDCDELDVPGVYARLGAPSINAFIADQIANTDGNEPVAMAWWRSGTPVFEVDPTPAPGERVTCAPGDVVPVPASAEVSLRLRRGTTVIASGPPSEVLAYTLGDADVGRRISCGAYAYTPGSGRYGSLRTARESAVVARPAPPAAPEPPAPSPPPVVEPPGPGPVPVPVPRDATAPKVSGFTRSCTRTRRCTLRLRIADALPSAGLRTPRVTLTSTYRTTCRRDGRARRCTKRVTKTLRARRSRTTGTYVVSTGVLRKGRHTVSVTVADLAGNRRRRPFTASFSLR